MNYSHKQLTAQYRKLHRDNKIYGRTSERLKSYFQKYINQLNPSSILDYGCGKSKLLNKLDVNASLYRYDPAIPEYASRPAGPFDLIINTDVLEHIPENLLPDILEDISSLSRNAAFCICLVEAVHKLPNGSNCHLTVKPVSWWVDTLEKYFTEIYVDTLIRNRKVLLTTWKT